MDNTPPRSRQAKLKGASGPGRHPPPQPLVERLRALCLTLPEVREEAAWAGTRWVIRKKNFAHILHIESGWPPAYARVARSDGPLDVLTFRSPVAEFNVFSFAQPPFFRPGWWPDIVGMVLDAESDWDEIALLLRASYGVMAPRPLADRVRAGSARESD